MDIAKTHTCFFQKITPRAHFREVFRAKLWMGGRLRPKVNARPATSAIGADKRP